MARNLQMNDASNQNDSASLTNAVGLVLRRIVRLMVGTVSFPALIEIMKTLYVEEAEKKIAEAVNEIQETLAMEIYEPSERGAGWAVTEAGCDSIESILRELIRKNN